jgi:hypothetical protein
MSERPIFIIGLTAWDRLPRDRTSYLRARSGVLSRLGLTPAP